MTIRIEGQQTPGVLKTCCDIWLAASLQGHNFVDAGLWQAKYDDMLNLYLPNADVHVAYVDDTPVGFSATSGDTLEALFIHPDGWGRGVGKALLLFLFSRHEQLHLAVYARNERAVRFYRHFSFETTGAGVCPHTGEQEWRMAWHSPAAS